MTPEGRFLHTLTLVTGAQPHTRSSIDPDQGFDQAPDCWFGDTMPKRCMRR